MTEAIGLLLAVGGLLWASRRTHKGVVTVEEKDAIRVLLAAGYDLEKNRVHLYRRKNVINVVRFHAEGDEGHVDEQFTDVEAAIERHARLAPDKGGA